MGIEDNTFFQWFADSTNPKFFDKKEEEMTPILYGFFSSLLSLLLFAPLIYRMIKVMTLPKTVRPKALSWLFIVRMVSMLISFVCCFARFVVPLFFGLNKTSIYANEQENEGLAYYIIIPNGLLCINWIIVMVTFYFERIKNQFFGTFVQVFILGSAFMQLLFISTCLHYNSSAPRSFSDLMIVLMNILYWVQVTAECVLCFSMLFKQNNRFINPQYKRVVTTNKEERDADRENSDEEHQSVSQDGSSIHFTPMQNVSVGQSYQNDTLNLLRNNQNIDSRKKPTKPFYERFALWWKFLTFSNIKDVLGFKRGYQKGMTMDVSDIDQLDVKNRSNFLVRQFEVAWEKMKATGKPKLFMLMMRLNGKQMLLAMIPRLIYDITMFIPIVAQTYMIHFAQKWVESDESSLDQPDPTEWQYQRYIGVLFGFFVIIISILSSMMGNYFQYLTTLVGQKMRSTLIMAMYERIFAMNAKSMSTTPHGQILNMMSVDCNCINDMCTQIHLIWSCSLEIIISIVWLFCVVGWPAVAGLVIMFVAVFCNIVLSKFIVKRMRVLMQIKDVRVKLMTEVLNAIKTVKVMVWEKHLHGQLHDTRKQEVKHILWVIGFRSCMNFIVWAIPPSVSFATYLIITLNYGGDLNCIGPAEAFITLGLFNIMRMPLIRFPKLLNDTMQGITSMRRIQEFLMKGEDEKDRDADNIIVAVETAEQDAPAIAVENATYTWEDTDKVALHDINFTAKKGELIGIIGEVGCGKTAFFRSLLGNLHKQSGMALYSGKIGYVAQNAWVQNLTVHDNVVFGKKHNNDLYERVVAACELRNDLENFPGADQMEVGIGGSNLSGGQKQRLALARATYQNADIYLLDDCLSAVDANVGQNIFNNCIKGVLSEKTRILITQTFQYLPECDRIYVMKNGTFIEEGTFEELNSNQRSEFKRLYSNYVANISHKDEHGKRILKRKPKKGVKVSQLIQKENVQPQQGPNSMLTYIKYGGWIYFLGVVLLFFVSSFLLIGSNYWLVVWTDESRRGPETIFSGLTSGYEYAGIYGAIIVVVLIFLTLRFICLGAFNGNASINLHFEALNRVLNSPMAFFQATPIGRILNRFSENLFVIDDKINLTLAQFIASITMTIVTIVITAYFNIMMIGIFVLSIYWFFYVFNWYLTYAKQLLRLDLIHRSPLYNSFQETLLGIDTIKSMKNNNRFTSILSEKLNKQQKIYYANNICQRWLGVRVELIGSFALGAVIIFGSMQIRATSPSIMALLILYMFQLNNILNQLIQSSVEVQTQTTAIQAVCEYLTLQPERGITEDDPLVTGHVGPNWPEEGDVKFEGVTMTYKQDLPPAVNDLTIHVKPGESVGIVGRTGAGKSSIMVTLFRLYEMMGGRIVIDGVDTNTLALSTLRQRLCVIPQEPVLFRGTLRKNLDILGQHTDEEMIQALEDVNIKEMIFNKNGLDTEISEGGANFSIGERQLICLARGLLSRSKVIVLDEATANVDLQTEKRIFDALFTHCKGSTMFMIAHRLHTILTCDKILMLEKGRVLGFGAPEELKKTCPEFAALVSKTGFGEEEEEEEVEEQESVVNDIPMPAVVSAIISEKKQQSSSSSSSEEDENKSLL